MILGAFKISMRVQMWDDDDGETVRGTAIGIDLDKKKVLIKWDDISEPCVHKEDEFPLISKSTK